MTNADRRFLYFAVFSSGMTTLAIEFGASHLLRPNFGASDPVWASIIGLILIYLTIGYFIGGAWADRSPRPKTMYGLLAWSAFTAGLAPLLARLVLKPTAEAFSQFQVGPLFGSFAVVLLLFSAPVTLQGMISPFAIRLAIADAQQVGQISGRIYAISTIGSFIGTFLPVLVLTPTIGTTYTFLAFSGFLNLVALLGLWRAVGWRGIWRWLWMPVALGALALWLGRGGFKATAGQIYEAESPYNYIQVLEVDGYRYLRLNEGLGTHSVWHPTQLITYGPWEHFLAAPFFNAPPFTPDRVENMAIIGLAAGTTARQATELLGPIPIDGWEIDPQIIAVGRQYFGMTEPHLNAMAEDGRVGLARSRQRYTIIGVDAYRPPYIPWHLTTREFFQEVRAHLADDGVLVINVGRSPTDRRLIDGLVGTISSVFPSVHVMDLPGTFNSIVYATVQPTEALNLFVNAEYLSRTGGAHPLLLEVLMRTAINLAPTPASQTVFTDDLAPIEWITNHMIIDFVLSGGVEDER
jgi:spermidine synthase